MRLLCLLLSFALVGKAAPEPIEAAPNDPASWPFVYEPGVFAPASEIDLRFLNESSAGAHGFVQRSVDGNRFVRGDGESIRFWGVNLGLRLYHGHNLPAYGPLPEGSSLQPERLRAHARWLAKMGVNLVRLHLPVASAERGAPITAVDDNTLDEIFQVVAAMKAEGIYTIISSWWPHANHVRSDKSTWGIDGYEAPERELWGVLFFHPELQRGYRAWLRELYTRPNPYTGVPLREEPAIAFIQLQNEDSLLFPTEANLHPAQRQRLADEFTRWIRQRYPNLEAAFTHWRLKPLPQDHPDRLHLLNILEINAAREGALARRAADQFEFYAELMYRFNRDTGEFLRQELGCRQLVNANNWRTADNQTMLDAERFTYTANEVVAVNSYFSGVHQGPQRGFRVNVGDRYRNVSALSGERSIPALMKHVAGHPSVVTESTWNHPNLFQGEAPWLVATYGAMSGLDGFVWYAFRAALEYDTDILYNQNKWSMAHPTLAGGFPAAALLFRGGYVDEAPAAAWEERSWDALWSRQPAAFTEGTGFDPNREADDEGSAAASAFLRGPIYSQFGRQADVRTAPVASDAHPSAAIETLHRQLSIDHARRLAVVDAPKAQGAVGFLRAAGPVETTHLRLVSANEYAHLLMVPLDGRPLAASRRILLQGLTVARPTGWQATSTAAPGEDSSDLLEITSLGGPPWRLRRHSTEVEVRGVGVRRATVLDPMGRRRAALPVKISGDTLTFSYPEDGMYVLLD